jgi:transcriptional regulator with XRE-family HTH domain
MKGGLFMVTLTTIRVVRAYLGISQGELAERMGVSISLVSAVEKGTNRISRDFIKRFKRTVGIGDSVLMQIEYIRMHLAK